MSSHVTCTIQCKPTFEVKFIQLSTRKIPVKLIFAFLKILPKVLSIFYVYYSRTSHLDDKRESQTRSITRLANSHRPICGVRFWLAYYQDLVEIYTFYQNWRHFPRPIGKTLKNLVAQQVSKFACLPEMIRTLYTYRVALCTRKISLFSNWYLMLNNQTIIEHLELETLA